MRKVLLLLIFTFSFNLLSTPSANAAIEVKISEVTHRLSDGTFFDDGLAGKLEPTGELGKLIYTNTSNVKIWLVDPSTIDEIIAMSIGYSISSGLETTGQEVAKNWLEQFLRVAKYKKVVPLTYGNPANFWVDEIIKDQISYLDAIGKLKLETFFNRPVENISLSIQGKRGFDRTSLNLLKYGQRQINLFSTVVDKSQIEAEQLRLAQLLNPEIDKQLFIRLVKDYDKSITQMRNKLNIKKSKFTLTNSKEELPITITNNFDQIVNLKLSSRAINSKVTVQSIGDIALAAKSKTQVLLPVEVLAAGESRLLIQLTNLEDKPVGYPVYIDLKLSLISPVTTWITISAAVLLILAALTQSVRRVRRGK